MWPFQNPILLVWKWFMLCFLQRLLISLAVVSHESISKPLSTMSVRITCLYSMGARPSYSRCWIGRIFLIFATGEFFCFCFSQVSRLKTEARSNFVFLCVHMLAFIFFYTIADCTSPVSHLSGFFSWSICLMETISLLEERLFPVFVKVYHSLMMWKEYPSAPILKQTWIRVWLTHERQITWSSWRQMSSRRKEGFESFSWPSLRVWGWRMLQLCKAIWVSFWIFWTLLLNLGSK